MLDTVLIKFLFYTKCLLLFEVVWNKYLFLAVDDEIKDFFWRFGFIIELYKKLRKTPALK